MRRVTAAGRPLAISYNDGRFGAVANACNHVGGPLGDGRLDGDYIVCPWHNCAYDVRTGARADGEPGERLRVVPVARRNGTVQVAVNVE